MPTTFPCLDVDRYRQVYPIARAMSKARRDVVDRRLAAILSAVDDDGRRLRPFPRGMVSVTKLADIERAERARREAS